MLNVNELESRWRKYKIKSYLPFGIIIVSTIAIGVGVFAIYDSKTIIQQPREIVQEEIIIQEKENLTQQESITKKEDIRDTKNKNSQTLLVVKSQEVAKSKTTLQPSLNFMQDMKHEAVSSYKRSITPTAPVVKAKPKPKPTKEKTVVEVDDAIEVQEVAVEKVPKSSIEITRQNTQEDISHVIKRFQKNNNPALSLFVAKKYYELGEYNEAYNYSLITNEINDKIETSWIIFTKSLVKLGKKDEAIKTLNKYISYSHSNQAKILLEEITSGKFK